MKGFVKYGLVPAVIFLLLLVATIIVLPVVINVQKYVPEIETQLSEATGRAVSIGPDLDLSFFPWLSVSLSDVKIGNPEGFLSDDFIKIGSFETKIKLLPLLHRRVEISRFIIGGLEVNLERRKDGRANWDFSDTSNGASGKTRSAGLKSWSLPRDLSVALFAVTDGTLYWSDDTSQSRHKVSDLMLLLKNVNLQNPAAIDFKAVIEGKSLAAEGNMGPLGQYFKTGALPIDLNVNMADGLSGQLKGKVFNLQNNPGYELHLTVPPFSGRKLLSSLDLDYLLTAADPNVFNAVQIDLTLRGDSQSLSVEKGKIKLDDASVDLTLAAKDFSHPDIHFNLSADKFNLNRYLAKENSNGDQAESMTGAWGKKVGNIWKDMTLDGTLHLQELVFGGGRMSNVNMQLHGEGGIFAVDPCTCTLYGGAAKTFLTIDSQSNPLQASVEIKTQGVDAQSLLHDYAAEDFLSGSLSGDIRLLFSGNNLETIKKRLYADGGFVVNDGVIRGIDMVNAKRNVVTQAGGSAPSKSDLITPFSELKSDFTIRNGLLETHETSIDSAAASLFVSGTVDLVGDQLELMITPNSGTAAKAGKENAGGAETGVIPFTLSGGIAEPTIHIDRQYFSEEELKSPAVQEMKNLVEEKLPAPTAEDVQKLTGKSLVDPTVVARHFGPQPEVIHKTQAKKQFKVISGKVRINPLREEESLH